MLQTLARRVQNLENGRRSQQKRPQAKRPTSDRHAQALRQVFQLLRKNQDKLPAEVKQGLRRILAGLQQDQKKNPQSKARPKGKKGRKGQKKDGRKNSPKKGKKDGKKGKKGKRGGLKRLVILL